MKSLSYDQIKDSIQKYKLKSISDLCAHFKSDYIAVIVGAFELGLDYSDFSGILSKIAHFDIDEYLFQISSYPLNIQKILIPKSVKSATALFLLAQDYYQDMSRNIISEIISENDYLTDVKNENIFTKNNIVFLAVNIDFKSEIPYLYQIQQKLKNLNLVFITESEKDFYELYKLNEFHQINKFSIKQIEKFNKEYNQDILTPLNITMTAEILSDFVDVNFKVQELIKEHEAVFDSLEVNKVWKDFLDSMKQDLTSDMIDSLAKYSITGQTGLSLLDFGVKGLRNLLFAINSNLDYSDDKIIKNYLLFKNSGKDSLKDWYKEFLLSTIYNIESKSNLNLSSNLSDNFLNEQYSNFISPYVRIFFAKYPTASSQETHEFIFNKIYEDITELKNS